MKPVLAISCILVLSGCDDDNAGHETVQEQIRDELFFPRSLVGGQFNEIRLNDDETILRSVREPTLFHLRSDQDAEAIRLLWKPALHPPVVVRAWRVDGESWIRVTRPTGFVRQPDGTPSFNSPVVEGHEEFTGIDSTYPIPDDAWNNLVILSEEPEIWKPLSELQSAYGDSFMDGDTWVLEKVSNGNYYHNRFPNPRFDPTAVGESRSYKSTVELGEFLVSLLPSEPSKWKRYRVDTGSVDDTPSTSGPFDPFTESGANKTE